MHFSDVFCKVLVTESFSAGLIDRFWRFGLRSELGARNGHVLIFTVILIIFLLLF